MANARWISVGNQRIEYLTKDEIILINGILDNPVDTSRKENADIAKRESIAAYTFSNYPNIVSEEKVYVAGLIKTLPFRELKIILPQTPIRQRSFFWLYGDWVFFEIIFWCLFGVLANLLYSTSEYLRKKEFDKLEIYVQIAKLVYSPFCVVIIYICFNELNSSNDYDVKYSWYSIAIAFLLGFFAGRMIELLTRLKDILIPLPTTKTTETSTQSQVEWENVPEEVLIEAIETNDEKWKEQFDVIDISVGKKKTNGIQTSVNALVFKPKIKTENPESSASIVPPTIMFKAKNGKEYEIPTDVEATGSDILPSFTINEAEKCDSSLPKRPGCSISRIGSEASGTLGLKVFKNGKSYLLSCYHVLCAPELDNGVHEFEISKAIGDTTIISPSTEDGGDQLSVLAKVTEGSLTSFMDCAIAEITNNLLVKKRICRIDTEPGSVIRINIDHVEVRYDAFMSGRTSGFQKGFIKSSFTSADINYSSGKKTIKGLISISPIARSGDSGAVVFDENSNVIGIVIARSSADTYIVPIQRILTQFQITLK